MSDQIRNEEESKHLYINAISEMLAAIPLDFVKRVYYFTHYWYTRDVKPCAK